MLLLIIAGVAGYAVWKAGQPDAILSRARAGQRRRQGWRADAAAVAWAPLPVVTANVKRADLPVYLNGLGNVTAFYTVTVKSRVDGQLMKVDFNEGDLVKKGQVLSKSIRGRIRCSSNWRKARWRAIRRC